jgi:hypothetical protein
LPALIRFDLGSVLGFEGRDRVSREILQAAKEDVDRVLGGERSQAHGAIAKDLDRKLSPRHPPELLADEFRDYDLTLAGHAGCGFHEIHLTSDVRRQPGDRRPVVSSGCEQVDLHSD